MTYAEWNKGIVQFSVDTGKLDALLYVNNIQVDSFSTTYKIDNECLSLKRKWTTSPLMATIIWGIGDWKVLLALEQKEDLVLFRASSGSTMLLFIPFFADGGQTSFRYKKVH